MGKATGGEKNAGRKKGQTEHRTAQLSTLATFRFWGSSTGAGRAGLPDGKSNT